MELLEMQGSSLSTTKLVLLDFLCRTCTRAEIVDLFQDAGFQPLEKLPRNRKHVVTLFYSQLEETSDSVEPLFTVLFATLSALKRQARQHVADGEGIRADFSKLLMAVRADHAELYSSSVGWQVSETSIDPPLNGEKEVAGRLLKKRLAVDLLLLSALTEEQQVVTAILGRLSSRYWADDDAEYFCFPSLRGAKEFVVAAASAYEMGALSLSLAAAKLFIALHPPRAVLVGIAAAVDTDGINPGDVPCASDVLRYDDIAVANGELTFRSQGFPVDPRMLQEIGRLRTNPGHYRAWQERCQRMIREVVVRVNHLRMVKITLPPSVELPHIMVGTVAGGPFLIRDADFRQSLSAPPTLLLKGVRVSAPLHPKLLSVEMESHGFMKAAHEAGIRAAVLKGISDNGDEGKRSMEKETGGFYRAFACANAVLAVLHALRVVPSRERLRSSAK